MYGTGSPVKAMRANRAAPQPAHKAGRGNLDVIRVFKDRHAGCEVIEAIAGTAKPGRTGLAFESGRVS